MKPIFKSLNQRQWWPSDRTPEAFRRTTDRFLVVGDKRVPDGGHRQLDSWARVKLVAIELRQNLVEIRRQLVASLLRYCAETDGRSLQLHARNRPHTPQQDMDWIQSTYWIGSGFSGNFMDWIGLDWLWALFFFLISLQY